MAVRVWNCIKIRKMSSFRWIHTLSLYLLQTISIWRLKHERIYSHYIDGWVKKTLESYWGDYLVTFKGVMQLKIVNETITSKAYQDNIKNDIKLQYESRLNILRYCKVRYLVECLGYSAFILEFYIAIDIILICLTGDCSITKLKLRDPYKSY